MSKLTRKSKLKENEKIKIVAVSGGFDPVHIGHVRLFEEAKRLGTHLVVILNSDEWLMNKKGYVFMPEQERAEIIKSFSVVDDVYIHKELDKWGSVSGALEKYRMKINGKEYKIDIFANGGDRKNEEDIPEAQICKKMGIEMVFNVGHGGKVQSSSWLIEKVQKGYELDIRPWGNMQILDAKKTYWVKRINVSPQHRLSLQSHSKRDEVWICIEGDIVAEKGVVENKNTKNIKITEKKILKPGDVFVVKKGEVHRISSKGGGALVEVATGLPKEEDIIRYQDDYGRA